MKEFQTILVPVDFSDNAPKILKSGIELARKFDATLHVIFVTQSLQDYEGFFIPHIPINKFEDELVQGAERKMEAFLHEHMDPSLSHRAKVFLGDPADEIVDYARRENIDLIVMGTHGYKGLERALFGSVADKVVKTAPCPVLTVNPYQ